jgi:IclR family acetate operon transcriptional repressor
VPKPKTLPKTGPKLAIQSLDRGLVILEAVGRSRKPVSFTDLAGLLGIDRSSAFRLAKTLKRRGFLTSAEGKTDFLLGPAIWRLARQYDWSNMLARISHEHLQALARLTGETAHLAVREGRHVLFIDQATVNQAIMVAGHAGELLPLHCAALGKALVLDLDLRGLKAILGAGPLESYTPQTVTTVEKLAKDCTAMRSSGVVTDNEECAAGLRCLAAPIRDKDGAIIASIGISAPAMRFPPDRHDVFAREVLKAAHDIRNLLVNQTDKEKQ